MRDKDSKKIEILYEDLAGNTFPQYGSNAPLVVAPMGTENLRSGVIEVPHVPNDEKDKTNEEIETMSPIKKILEDLRDTIKKIELRNKERMTRKINRVINQESTIREGILGGALQGLAGAGVVARGIKQGSTSFDPVRTTVDLLKRSEKESSTGSKTIGFGDKQKKPILNKDIVLSDSSDVVGKIVSIDKKSNRFTVELQGNFYFAKDKSGKIGYTIINLTNDNKDKIQSKYDLVKTLEVGQNTKFPNWFYYTGNTSTIGTGTSTVTPSTNASQQRSSVLNNEKNIKPVNGSTYEGMDPTGSRRVVYTYNKNDGWSYQTRNAINFLKPADQQILTKKWRKQWVKYLESGKPTNATYGPPKTPKQQTASTRPKPKRRGNITPNPSQARIAT
jgi:hypothetical protein